MLSLDNLYGFFGGVFFGGSSFLGELIPLGFFHLDSV